MKLKTNTVSQELLEVLRLLNKSNLFDDFVLVGGTALSLYYGHRLSVDIDLFTDAIYGSIDFKKIDLFLKSNFKYCEFIKSDVVGIGKSYYVGNKKSTLIKLDIYYTDNFIEKYNLIEGIKIASLKDLAAMKLEVITITKRKKDFWDLNELLKHFTLKELLHFHKQRYPSHKAKEIINSFSKINQADDDFDPICLKGNYWELIKYDLLEIIENH